MPRDEQRITPRQDVLSRVLDGEAVLLDLESGTYFGLNDVGTRVWQLIVAGSSVGEIKSALIDEFDVSADRLSRDLDELLLGLEKRGLVDLG